MDTESVGQSDHLWFRCIYDSLFLYRTQCRFDADFTCSYLLADTVGRHSCFCCFLGFGTADSPSDRQECEILGGMSLGVTLKTYKQAGLQTQNMLSLCQIYGLLDVYDDTGYK